MLALNKNGTKARESCQKEEGGEDSPGATWKDNQDKLCCVIAFPALAPEFLVPWSWPESQPPLLSTLNLVLMLALLLRHYLGLCFVSPAWHWLTALTLGTSCCFLREPSCFPVPGNPVPSPRMGVTEGRGGGKRQWFGQHSGSFGTFGSCLV